MGHEEEAREVLARIEAEMPDRQDLRPIDVAIVYGALGEKDQAFLWLDKAYEEQVGLSSLKMNPHFDLLRDDPRFDELLKKVGLAE